MRPAFLAALRRSLGLGDFFDHRLNAGFIDQPPLVKVCERACDSELFIALQTAENHSQDGKGGVAKITVVAIAVNAFFQIGLGDAFEHSSPCEIDQVGDFHPVTGGVPDRTARSSA